MTLARISAVEVHRFKQRHAQTGIIADIAASTPYCYLSGAKSNRRNVG
jgi:hypothetical protein